MLQIIDLENNELFTQVSSEESASVNGAGILTAAAYQALATNLLGIGGTETELNTTFLFAIDAQLGPGQNKTP